MTNQFLVIIKNTDEGKFNWFKNKKFNKSAKEILDNNNSNYVWGIHKGIINDKIWKKIKKNDKIYLTTEEENFRISGNLSKKIKNSNYGEIIYPNTIDKKQINYFLFFEKLDICNFSYHELINDSTTPKRFHQGVFERKQKPTPKKLKKTKVNKALIEKTLGAAEKRHRSSQVITRNQSNVNQLKKLYDNQCQIEQCNFKLDYEKNGKIKQFSNVHHYNQIAKSLIDSLDNMIVLCPNHHAEFDFKVKFIDHDGETIIDRKGKETGETIKFHKNHKLNSKYIESLLEL